MASESRHEADELLKTFAGKILDKKRDEEESRKVIAKRKFVLFIITFFILAMSSLIYLSVTTITINLAMVNPASNVSNLNYVCAKACSLEHSFLKDYNSKQAECYCTKISFLSSVSKLPKDIHSYSAYKIDKVTAANFSISTKELCTLEIFPNANLSDLSWDRIYLLSYVCKDGKSYALANAKRSDFNLNEPPKIVISARFSDSKKQYKRFYVKTLSENEHLEVTFDASESHDPDGTILRFLWDENSTIEDTAEIRRRFDWSNQGKHLFNLKAYDDKDEVTSANVTLMIRQWEIGKERSGYLLLGAIITILLTLAAFNYFKKFLELRKSSEKALKSMNCLVKSIFFGGMLNFINIIITVRLVYLPQTFTRVVTQESFLPNTEIENPMTAVYIKAAIIIFILVVMLILYRKSGLSMRFLFYYLKEKAHNDPLIILMILLAFVFFILFLIKLKF